jgi:uncharacterized protein YhaN
MRIRQLSLIKYGKFTDRVIELPNAPRDIHVIVGPNEAGKSTARSAISDLLFGIPMRTPLDFLHPKSELRLGGVIEDGEKALAFHRSKGNKQTLRTPEDAVLADTALQPWLGESGRPFFEKMFALDHGALVRGGDGILSAADDLGRMLFQSATGIDHLGRVLKDLETEEETLWAPRKSASREYYAALDAYEQATATLKTASARPKAWKDQLDAKRQVEKALEEIQKSHSVVRVRRSQLERIRRVLPALRALDEARTHLEAMGQVPLLPENASSILIEADRGQALADAEIRRNTETIATTESGLKDLPLDHTLLATGSEIQELDERRLQYRSHRADIIKREEEVRVLWLRVQDLASGLGWACGTEDEVKSRLPTPALKNRLDELIQRQATLDQERQSARRSLKNKQDELDQALEAVAALPLDAVSPALQAALDVARKLGDHAATLQELRLRRDRQATDAGNAFAQLGPWRAEPEILRAMVVPDATVLQGFLSEERSDASALKASEKHLSARQTELDKSRLELDQLVATFQPVSREQVLEARQARDADWQTIKKAPGDLLSRVETYEHLVAQADGLADARLEKIQHEADRQARAYRIETLELEIKQEQGEIESTRLRKTERAHRWSELAMACALPGLPVEIATEWLASRRKALDAQDALVEATRQLDASMAAGEEARLALAALLIEPGGTIPEASLEECIRTAESMIDQSSLNKGQRATLEKQIAQAHKAMVALKEASEDAERDWQSWNGSWTLACQEAAYPQDTSIDEVRGGLEDLGNIENALEKIQSIRVDRINAMQTDLDGLKTTAQDLAERIAPDLSGHTAEDILASLMARLSANREASAEAQRLKKSLAQARIGLDQARAQQEVAQASMAPLYIATGDIDRAAMTLAIERSDARRQYEQEVSRATQGLNEGGDGLTINQLREEAQSIDANELASELDRLGVQEDGLVNDIRRRSTELEQATAALATFDGSDKAAVAESNRQDAIARMSQAVERYLKLRTASRLLRWSIDRYRQTQQGPMLSLASEIFTDLTLGSFSRLVVDFDADTPKLQGLRPDNKLVSVEGMSEGTRDQLYMALRLAALDMHVGQNRPLPFVADDLFINFDDLRTAAGLKALGELSRKTQVLFLTHHDHLVPLVQKVLGAEVNVVTL